MRVVLNWHGFFGELDIDLGCVEMLPGLARSDGIRPVDARKVLQIYREIWSVSPPKYLPTPMDASVTVLKVYLNIQTCICTSYSYTLHHALPFPFALPWPLRLSQTMTYASLVNSVSPLSFSTNKS